MYSVSREDMLSLGIKMINHTYYMPFYAAIHKHCLKCKKIINHVCVKYCNAVVRPSKETGIPTTLPGNLSVLSAFL